MELTQGSETSANYNLTPGKYPKEYIQKTICFVGLEKASGKALLVSCRQFQVVDSFESEEATKSPDLRLKISLFYLYNLNHVFME